MLRKLFHLCSSLKLTVVCLIAGCVLVFWGTLAQVHVGLFKAQNEFFRSFFVYWQPGEGGFEIPVFPGGYLLGTILLINLLAAHLRFYKPGKKKFGIMLIHLGIVLMLVGQMVTDALSRESAIHLRIGQSADYSEAQRDYELAITDTTDPNSEKVVAIPVSLLVRHPGAAQSQLPFALGVKTYYPNSDLSERASAGYQQVMTTAGFGDGFWWRELPRETAMDRVDMPSAIIEVSSADDAPQTFLVSALLNRPQVFTLNGHSYEVALRPKRFYMPFSLKLLEFHHDNYPGTDIPRNFSSRVQLDDTENHDNREVLIHMNNPLRYDGLTFYQASYDPDNGGSILQVVRNPGWLTPYCACGLVGLGLAVQFLSHLIPFLKRRLAT